MNNELPVSQDEFLEYPRDFFHPTGGCTRDLKEAEIRWPYQKNRLRNGMLDAIPPNAKQMLVEMEDLRVSL